MKRILIVIAAIMFMSFYAVVSHTQSEKKAIEMLDSILKRDGYVAFNQYEEYINGTYVGLLIMHKDSTYISRRHINGDTSIQYDNRWELREDTLIFFEDNTEAFLDNEGEMMPDSDLCLYLKDSDRYTGYPFGRLFIREYEIGHTLEWRNMVALEVKKDSIGLYLRPNDYCHSGYTKVLFRHVHIPLSYKDNFIPYYFGQYLPDIMNSPFQMVRFPHLTHRYGLDVDSLRKAYKNALNVQPSDYPYECVYDSAGGIFQLNPPKNINSKKQKYEEPERDE